MLVMWAIEYDIIVETLTGTEIEVTLTDDDTAGYIKLHIQKYEGILIIFLNEILVIVPIDSIAFFVLSFSHR